MELLQGLEVISRLQSGSAAEQRQLHGGDLRHGEGLREDPRRFQVRDWWDRHSGGGVQPQQAVHQSNRQGSLDPHADSE